MEYKTKFKFHVTLIYTMLTSLIFLSEIYGQNCPNLANITNGGASICVNGPTQSCTSINNLTLTVCSALNQSLIRNQINYYWYQKTFNTSWEQIGISEDITLDTINRTTQFARISCDGQNQTQTSILLVSIRSISIYDDDISYPATCTSEGSLVIEFQGGSGVYEYFIPYNPIYSSNGWQLHPGVIFLSEGTYEIWVRDQQQPSENHCEYYKFEYYMPGESEIEVEGQKTELTCQGDNDGAIDITVSSSSNILTYEWSNNMDTEDISGLSAGVYTVRVSSGQCEEIKTFEILSPPPLSVPGVRTDPTCQTLPDGSIDISPTGGSGSYTTFTWTKSGDPNFSRSTEDISGLDGGFYSVEVEDSEGCIGNSSFALSAQVPFTVVGVPTHVTCHEANDGKINVNVTGGSGINYQWSDVAGNSNFRENLEPGEYTVTVSDNNGCEVEETIIITEPSQSLSATAIPTETKCFGENSGSIDLSVSGGTKPYSFEWKKGFAFIADIEDPTMLEAGDYQVTITDSNDCTFILNDIEVIQPTEIILNCLEFSGPLGETTPDGVAQIVVSNITTSWSATIKKVGSSFSTTTNGSGNGLFNVEGLTAGAYNVTITDDAYDYRCQATCGFILTKAPCDLELITENITDLDCPGDPQGAIDITLGGGILPYDFAWSNEETSQNINGLSAGTYTVTVTEDNGCQSAFDFTVSSPAAIGATIAPTPISCFGEDDGALSLQVTGGTPPYSYNWNNGIGVAGSSVSNLGPGSYRVTVSDAKNCTKTFSKSLIEPAQLEVSCRPIQADTGGDNGEIGYTILGGSKPYTVTINNISQGMPTYSNSEILKDNLAANQYVIEVTDVHGCVKRCTVDLELCNFIVNDTVTYPACESSVNGKIILEEITGYSYKWSNGATSTTISGLKEGTYTVTVTKNAVCNRVFTYILSPSSNFDVEDSVTQPICTGTPPGKIELNITGGSGNRSILWNTGSTTATLNNLTNGLYCYTVRDLDLGCVFENVIEIEQEGNVEVIVNYLGESRYGNFDTEYYQISLKNALPNENYMVTSQFNNPQHVDHIGYSISMNGDETKTMELDIYVDDQIEFSVNAPCQTSTTIDAYESFSSSSCAYDLRSAIITPACSGSNSGRIELPSNYNYLWTTLNNSTDRIQDNLSPGTYHVRLRKTGSNLCTEYFVFTIPSKDPASVFIARKNVNCQGNNTGSAFSFVKSGNPPFTYAWNTGDTTKDIENLAVGTYTVTVTETGGCTSTQTVTISEPSVPLAITSANEAQPESCFGAKDGNIAISVSGGTEGSGYQYIWSNGASGPSITSLSQGDYHVTVVDANLCPVYKSFTVTGPVAELTLDLTGQDPDCFGGNNGTLSLISAGGNLGDKTTAWSDGQTPNQFNRENVVAGTYSATITDSKGCSDDASYTILEPDQFDIEVGTSQNISCHDGADGAISIISISGGTTPYSYVWSNGATSANLATLLTGTYTLTVTDMNGCIAEPVSIFLDQPQEGIVTGTTVDVLCYGEPQGEITLSLQNIDDPNPAYAWSDGSSNGDRTGLVSGSYTITVTYGNGCEAMESFSIFEPEALTVTADSMDATCNGFANGYIELSVEGGTAPITFNWSNGDINQNAYALAAGDYSVTISDGNGCSVEINNISIFEPPVLSINQTLSPPNCPGDVDGAIDIHVSGGSLPYQYQWNNGSRGEDLEYLPGGNYAVTITDANNCVISSNYSFPEVDSIKVEAMISDESCFLSGDGSIDLVVTGGIAPYSFLWADSVTSKDRQGLSSSDLADSLGNVIMPGYYYVMISDAGGCHVPYYTIPIMDSLFLAENINNPNARYHAQFIEMEGEVINPSSVRLEASQSIRMGPGFRTNGADFRARIVPEVEPDTDLDFKYRVKGKEKITAAISGPSDVCPSVIYDFVLSDTSNCVDCSILWDNGETGLLAEYEFTQAGTQTLIAMVMDGDSCMASFSHEVNVHPSPVLQIVAIDTIGCIGDLTTLSVSSSVEGSNVDFLWNNFTVGKLNSSLPPGEYWVTQTDSNGCSNISDTFAIISPDTLRIDSFQMIEPICPDSNDGLITIFVSGGTGGHSVNWSDGQDSLTAINLAKGEYFVTVTDDNQCQIFANYILDGPSEFVLDTTIIDETCYQIGNGSISLSLSGGTPPYSYQWDNGDSTSTVQGLISRDIIDSNGVVVEPGFYTVIITDSKGCTPPPNMGEDLKFRIRSGDSPTANIIGGIELCDNLSYTYNLADIQYCSDCDILWSNGDTTLETTYQFNTEGEHNISVTLTRGSDNCTNVISLEVYNNLAPDLAFEVLEPIYCETALGTIEVNPSGDCDFQFAWSYGGADSIANNLQAGIYQVTVVDPTNDCMESADFSFEPIEFLLDCQVTEDDVQVNVSNEEHLLSIYNRGELIQEVVATASYSFTDLPVGTYTIVAQRDSCSEFCIINIDKAFEFSAPAISEISESQDDMQTKIHPNPFHQKINLNLSLTKGDRIAIDIHSLNGDKVLEVLNDKYLEKGAHQMIIDLKAIPRGMYLIRIKSSLGMDSHRILKL